MLSTARPPPLRTTPPGRRRTAPSADALGRLGARRRGPHDLKAIAKLPSKDPFQAAAGSGRSVTTATQPLASSPRVRLSHFVSKDPFKARSDRRRPAATQASHTRDAPAGDEDPGYARRRTRPFGYIVILRSLDTKAAGKRS